MPERLGVFGGTFDPPHLAHLALAEWARDRLALGRVLFVPAARPPHKRGRRLSPASDRLAMTRLAVRGNPAFAVSDLELSRSGPSYTVDTLRELARRHPAARLFLLVGADSLDEFPTWRDPRAILSLATLAVAGRPLASAASVPSWARHGRVVRLANPELQISSSSIRSWVGKGRSIRYLVPERVAAYLERRRLYRRSR